MPVTSVAARTAPDSLRSAGWGDAGAGGRFLLAKRCFWACRGALPFSPGSGSHSRFLPSRCFLPRPRPFLLDSDILPWVPGSGTDARRAVWDGLRSPLPCAAPPLPAAPVPERGACLIGGHTLRGRGAASLNSSPPAPAALIPPPHRRRGWRGRRASCARRALSPGHPPSSGPLSDRGRSGALTECHRPPHRRRGWSWAGGLSPDSGAGSRDPAARARLRTAGGWGDSERRAQEGTKTNEAHWPAQWGRTHSCSLLSVSTASCPPLP